MAQRHLLLLAVVIIATATAIDARSLQQTESLSLNEKTPMEIVLKVARDHPQVTQYILDQIKDRLAGVEEADRYIKDLTTILANPTDGRTCNACLISLSLLKVWTRVLPWDEMKVTIIDFCELLLTALDDTNQGKVLCPGVVNLQGSRIYSIVGRTTSDDLCPALNACYEQADIDPAWPVRPTAAEINPIQQLARKQSVESFNDLTKTQTEKQEEFRVRRAASGRVGPVKIAHITDVHLELEYDKDSADTCGLYVCCTPEHIGNVSAGAWGNYKCNIPTRTIQLFLDKIQTDLAPDYIIFSGDVPPHTMWDETLDSQFTCTERLVEMMNATFPDTRVLPSIGNHEMYPTNLFSVRNDENDTVQLLDRFTHLWRDIAGFNDSNVASFQSWGHYSTLLEPGLRVIAIMTNYMYTANFYNALNHKVPTDDSANDGEALLAKEAITALFEEAKTAEEKVIVLGHHVVGNSDYIVSEAKWYEQLVSTYSDIIVLQLAGHTHTDEFRLMFKEGETTPSSILFVNPSVDTHGTRNPSIRMYELAETSFQLNDYTQYYFDLSTAGNDENTPPTIEELYSAKSEYVLEDLSPESWLGLLNRFMQDESLVLKHINNERANAGAHRDNCDEDCRLRHVCRQRYASYDRVLQCNALYDPSTTTRTTTTTTRPTLPTLTDPSTPQPATTIGINSANVLSTHCSQGIALLTAVAILFLAA